LNNNNRLIEVGGGITIKELNNKLDERELGLINMGGYNAQTIVGVISTSTHGSGIKLVPFCDMVRSIVIAVTGKYQGQGDSDVNFFRIEPTNGITNPKKYKSSKIILIQDDDCFYSVCCSMGCFGVIYSVVLEVRNKYYLKEKRIRRNLDHALKSLQKI